MAPEIWCAVDGGSDRQIDGQTENITYRDGCPPIYFAYNNIDNLLILFPIQIQWDGWVRWGRGRHSFFLKNVSICKGVPPL